MTQSAYSMKGDRGVEYPFATDHTPAPFGKGRLLDVGPGERAKLGTWAKKQGWEVTAVDPFCKVDIPGIRWLQADITDVDFASGYFDCIYCVSTLEHIGIPGRYGVKAFTEDLDMTALCRMHKWLSKDGLLILTVPVGHGQVLAPFHRIYDEDRLLALTAGLYQFSVCQFWNKQDGIDSYRLCTADEAYSTKATLEPRHYYAIGGFVLKKEAM